MTNTLTAEQEALDALDWLLEAPERTLDDAEKWRYDLIRKALASIPSPPVSGEAVTQLLATALDGLMRLYDDVDEGDKTAPEFVAACAALRQFRGFSPLTNEPVGVTRIETAHLEWLVNEFSKGHFKGRETAVKHALDFLSAAIGERG